MRRQQLSEAEIATLFDPLTDQRELLRHYTLTETDTGRSASPPMPPSWPHEFPICPLMLQKGAIRKFWPIYTGGRRAGDPFSTSTTGDRGRWPDSRGAPDATVR